MIAISSRKPLGKSPEVDKNQAFSMFTWYGYFPEVIFINRDDYNYFPTIREMVEVASKQTEWTCLINADIQINKSILQVESELIRLKADCAISLRWQIPDNKIVDQGLDWFAATPEMWKKILPRVPRWFRIGHCIWDTWMLGAFMHFSNGKCYDCTASKFIFHPKHESRDQPYNADMRKPNDGFIDKLKWPKNRIDVTKST